MSATHDQFISSLTHSLESRLPGADGSLATAFAVGLWGAAPDDELIERDPENDASATIACFRAFQHRQSDEFRVSIINPEYDRDGWQSSHTIVLIVCPDMPFVVDSVLMELSHHDLVTHYLGNTVFRTQRDPDGVLEALLPNGTSEGNAEGFIYAEIDRVVAGQLAALRLRLEETLDHVRVVVRDFAPMKAQLHRIISELETDAGTSPAEEVQEVIAFLHWIDHENFTFLGYREFDYLDDEMRQREGTSLGILTLRAAASTRRLSEQSEATRAFLLEPTLLSFSKSGTKCRVHRPAYPDSVSVKRFDDTGQVIGEQTFLGLYTSPVYTERPSRIPCIRRKVERVIEQSPFEPRGFDGKVLAQVLATYPRDELFQMSEAELLASAVAITYLHERRKTRVFLRRDRYGLFYTCLVYIPRELYNTHLRVQIQNLLIEVLAAEDFEFEPYFSESILVRLQFNLRVAPGSQAVFDDATLEQQIIELASDWSSELNEALVAAFGESRGRVLSRRYASAFPAGYREHFSARTAAYDVSHTERLSDSRRLVMRFSRLPEADRRELNLKVFHLGEPLPLSDLLPQLEHMGLRVNGEHPYRIGLQSHPVSIQDFHVSYHRPLELDQIGDRFEDAFIRIWVGSVDDDSFNRLILAAGLTWRQVAVLRSYAHYMKQIRFGFSEHFISDTLNAHATLACQLVELFECRFDPATVDRDRYQLLGEEFVLGLDDVELLNEDRILRRFAELIDATERTNYYCGNDEPRSFLSIKLAPGRISELPRPVPQHEIFVCAPHMEGVHLRGGPIARGGLRWSDRLEDFRTEVLGLAKAQIVKNAVIVPTGAKGGFVIKTPPGGRGDAPDVTRCYQDFIRGLLDVTDNYIDGALVAPERVVRYDADDPYLVVAADKGTASFSDVANAIADDYRFWLGDAFASGGSNGYDHKKMGITARGAWISVQRHFRERNLDVQRDSITVIGIGDMSGDVFGNGMLMSDSVKLVAAFNHLHIFIDPDPDPTASLGERQRLFERPRSSWADYDLGLLSAGGGIYERSAKSIELGEAARTLFDISAPALSPDQLIHELLKAPIDLIWNGGIGTYVKSTDETHVEVGDRANDNIRIAASQLRCQVFGEGGNLGMTQAARVEFARGGGSVNTDFIDNAGGVDCSDHEVNIKILLDGIVNAGDMTIKQRNLLLEEMTDAVADLVLTNNFRQAQALSLAEQHLRTRHTEYQRFISQMEQVQDLDRELETIPSDEALSERFVQGGALTRPELAVLLAYAKIYLKEQLIASEIHLDPTIARQARSAFPALLRERYDDAIGDHRLIRELIATQLANDLVHHMGITFVAHVGEFIGSRADETVKAYLAAMDTFRIRESYREIEALDDVAEDVRLTLMLEQIQLGRRATRWFLRHRRAQLDVGELVTQFGEGIELLRNEAPRLMGQITAARRATGIERLQLRGLPEQVALRHANAAVLAVALPVIDAADSGSDDLMEILDAYAQLGSALRLDWLTEQLVQMPTATHWQAMERDALLDDVTSHQGSLATRVLQDAQGADKVAVWLAGYSEFTETWRGAIESAQQAAVQDFSLFSMTCRKLNDLCRMLSAAPPIPLPHS
jgi:glutamate dehydrogenase